MSIQKALVVDDSKSARFSIKKMLQKMSVGVDFAMSAEEAMAYLGKLDIDTRPDIIFMDHLMPGMDGFEATKTIKQNKDWAAIPVVMCTSKEGSEYLEQAQSYGAIDILPKPASLKEISRILDQLGGTPEIKPLKPAPASYTTISAGMSRDAIEKLARDTANGVAKHTLEKLVEDRLKQFRRELFIECENVAQQAAGKAIKQVSEEIQSNVVRLSKPQLNEIATSASQTAANTLILSRFNDLSNQVMLEVEKQLAEIREAIDKPLEIAPDLIEEIKNMARSVANDTAVKSAEEAAERIAAKTATDIAETCAELKSTEIAKEAQIPLEAAIQKSQRRAFAVSAIAILCSVAVYFIK